jgi:putative FmdB family regulatory protein
MPLYEYHCPKCGSDCELLVRNEGDVKCPQCGNVQLERQLSVVAAPTTSSKMGDLPVSSCRRPECGQGRCMGMM